MAKIVDNVLLSMFFADKNIFVSLCRVSLIRPAPVESPQDRKVARVDG